MYLYELRETDGRRKPRGNHATSMRHICIDELHWMIVAVKSFLSYQVRDGGRDTVVPGEGVLLRPLVQWLDQLRGEPALMAVELPHPAVLVALGDDGDDVVLPEAQLVIVPPLKVDHGSEDVAFFRYYIAFNFNSSCTEFQKRRKERRDGIRKE